MKQTGQSNNDSAKAPDSPQEKVPSLEGISRVEINFINHADQRYRTCGDWYFTDGFGNNPTLVINVSKTGDARSDFAVARHEFDEATLCIVKGITAAQVDEFDMGQGADYDEPGNHPSAPYHKQHIFATAQERRYVETMGVPWDQHSKNVDDLDKE